MHPDGAIEEKNFDVPIVQGHAGLSRIAGLSEDGDAGFYLMVSTHKTRVRSPI